MPWANDDEFVAALLRGEIAAFEDFRQRFGPLIRSMAWRLSNSDRNRAREYELELFSDVLYQLCAGKWQVARGSLSGWIGTVAYHAAVSRVRSDRHLVNFASLDALILSGWQPRAHEPDPAEAAAKRELEKAVADCVRELPDAFRGVVELRLLGYSYEGIAEATREAGIKDRVSRGRKLLRECLEKKQVYRGGTHGPS